MKSHASMNRIYRLVFNAALGIWVAVAENAKGRGKGGRAASALIAILAIISPSAYAANAADATRTGGAGTVTTVGNTTTINQTSQRLALDWTQLSTVAGETLSFVQPNAQAIALNRITGISASNFLGSLTATGQVFILNPNGILFGAGSQVNVGGLVASTLELSSADFMNGSNTFTRTSGRGSVVNQGSMTAASGGYLALLAPEVRNEGVMTATLGTALLAAGNKVTLNLDNGSLLGYSIDQGAINALAENKQLIKADGGQVLLSARAMDALTTATVNNTGVIEARTIQNKAGRIMLMGDMEHGTVNVGGTLDASAPNGGDGGFIETSAAHVKVATGTRVTTRAAAGQTGKWLIDPNDFTISATGDMDAATVVGNLATTNFEIQTATMGTAGNGDIHVNEALTWSSANTLTLTAERNININQAITATNGGLTLNAVNQISAPAAVNVGTFTLAGGTWRQVGSLPTFSATDFRINGGTFIRALGGDGTSAFSAYQIADIYGLQGADSSGMQGKSYKLANNIDASGTVNWNSGAGFKPIGQALSAFSGAFDGNKKTINGLTINRATSYFVGLFGVTGHHVAISNVGLVGGSVSGFAYVGGLVGHNQGTISNAYATGSVSGDRYIGGLLGQNTGSISKVYATGSVSGDNYIGGLMGMNQGTISNAYATGSVSGDAYIGGLVGWNTATISNAYATGNVSGNNLVGGLVGYQSFGTVTTSFWLNSVSTTGFGVRAGTVDSTTRGLSNAEFSSSATYTSWYVSNVGGSAAIWRIYEGETGPLLRSFLTPLNLTPAYDGSATLLANIGSVAGPVGTDPSQLLGTQTDSTLTLSSNGTSNSFTASASTAGLYSTQQGYDISNTARTIASTGSAAGNVNVANSINYTNGALVVNAAGSVSLNGITSANGSVAINAVGSVTNTGATDVALFDLKGGAWSQASSTLPAFAADDFRITGGSFLRVLGGDGASAATAYQIADIYGLQGADSSGMLGKKYRLANNIDASGTVNWNSGAGFNSIGDGTTAFSGTFDGNSKTITGLTINRATSDYVGLFGATSSSAAISNVGLVGGSASGHNNVGALVGYNAGTISNAYATGSISGSDNIGGLVGYNSGTISNAYSTGSVSGANFTGGLVGSNYSGSITKAYSTGNVNGNGGGDTGGLVGNNSNGSVTNSFWNTDTSGQATSTGGGTGINSAQMMQAATFAGWDMAGSGGSTAVWRIYEGHTGPLLRSFLTARTLANTSVTYKAATQNATATTAGLMGTAASGRNAGSYVTGFYSTQQGYDLSGGSLIINKANLTLAAVGDNKIYNGTTTSTAAVSTTGLLGTDNVTTLTQSFGSKDVLGRRVSTLSVDSGYTLNDGNGGGNYNVTRTATVGTINKATLSVTGVVADNRTYDGTNSATLSNIGTLSGLVGGETLALSQTAATFDSKNAGTGKVVTATGYAIANGTGGLASNYQLASTSATTSANVAKANLTLAAVAESKTYDGTTASTVAVVKTGLVGGDSLTSLTQSFGSKNVLGADRSTLAVDAGYTIADGNSGGNYNVTTATAVGTINKASLTLAAVTDSKTYDGTTASTAAVSTTGLLGTDNLTTLTQSFGSKNVLGTGASTLAVDAGYTLNDGNSGGNYNVTVATSAAAGTINKATLNVTGVAADNKTYNGTNSATLSNIGTLSGLVGAETLALSQTAATFNSKNVGSGKVVTATGYGIADGSGGTAGLASNYQLASTSATASANIDKAALAVTANTVTKTYDGTTSAIGAGTVGTLAGAASLETISSAGSQAFADKNAATGKTVIASGVTIKDSANADVTGNYDITYVANTNSVITKATLSVTGVVADNKTYNGTDLASLSNIGTLSGLVIGEALTLSQTAATFADKNAGVGKTVTATGYGIANGTGGLASNYQLASTTATASADIDKATVSVTGVAANNKTYNGNDAATLSSVGTLSGLVAGEALTLRQTAATFADKNAGTGKVVTAMGYGIANGAGGLASNYQLASTTATTSANIDKATVSVTGVAADNKTYNGSDLATLSSIGTLSGLVIGEALTLSQTAATFADKNAGIGKTVTATGYGIANGTGGLASNYQLASTTATTSANIDKAALTVTANTVTRTYDGTSVATGNGTVSALAGSAAGEVVNSAGTQAFLDKNFGIANKTVRASGVTIKDSGNADVTGNYAITYADNTVSTINKATLNISATPENKVYDGTTMATASYTDNRMAGDVLTYSANASFADRNVANGIVVTVGGITTSGLDAGNYTVGSSTVVGNTANITPAALTITANNDTRLAGPAYSGGNGVVYSGLVGGETAAVLTGALAYSGSSQGASAAGSYAITPGGQASSNYAISFNNGTLTLTPAREVVSVGFAGLKLDLSNPVEAYNGALSSFSSSFKSDIAAALGVDTARINVQSLNSAANDE